MGKEIFLKKGESYRVFSTACQWSDAGKRLCGYCYRIYSGLRGIEYRKYGAWRNFHDRRLYRPASGNGSGNEYFPCIGWGAVLGYGLELLALRPLRKHKATHLAPLISTIGVSTFLESVALMVWGPQTRSFPSAFGNELMDMGVFKISGIQIISLGTAVVLMVLLTIMLNRTKVGKAIRATSENAETAGLLGINTGRIITLTVMLASALGAAAGVLIGLSFNAIEPTMGTSMGLKGLAVLIMGGLGNVEGAMAGGFILGIAEVFSVAYGTSSYRDAVAFGLIILILFIRPEGLFAKAGKGGRP